MTSVPTPEALLPRWKNVGDASCRNYKGVFIPNCMGGAVYGKDRCTCQPCFECLGCSFIAFSDEEKSAHNLYVERHLARHGAGNRRMG